MSGSSADEQAQAAQDQADQQAQDQQQQGPSPIAALRDELEAHIARTVHPADAENTSIAVPIPWLRRLLDAIGA